MPQAFVLGEESAPPLPQYKSIAGHDMRAAQIMAVNAIVVGGQGAVLRLDGIPGARLVSPDFVAHYAPCVGDYYVTIDGESEGIIPGVAFDLLGFVKV